jgi:hypothetical protein
MTIPLRCQPIADRLQNSQDLLAELDAEYREETNARDKMRTFMLIRSVRSSIITLQKSLDLCVNPPPPMPDLMPVAVTPNRQPDGVHPQIVIFNNGPGPASGPFKITFGTQYVSSYDQDPPLYSNVTFDIDVPASQTFPPGVSTNIDTNHKFPALVRPGTIEPVIFWFYVMVDPDNQVPETNEGNNYYETPPHGQQV